MANLSYNLASHVHRPKELVVESCFARLISEFDFMGACRRNRYEPIQVRSYSEPAKKILLMVRIKRRRKDRYYWAGRTMIGTNFRIYFDFEGEIRDRKVHFDCSVELLKAEGAGTGLLNQIFGEDDNDPGRQEPGPELGPAAENSGEPVPRLRVGTRIRSGSVAHPSSGVKPRRKAVGTASFLKLGLKPPGRTGKVGEEDEMR